MSRLDARLAKLEHRTPSACARQVTVWIQDDGGADTFTSPQHPGVALTGADLDELPTDPGTGISVIVVRYEAAREDA